MTMTQNIDYLLRILLSLALGVAIGLERKMRYKEAGMRTHAIVSIGACLMMIISKYGFSDVGDTDGSRIAAQIVSGIGFLGAGMIIYKKEALHGLTTAAGIWTTAGIGMCVGTGMFFLSIGTTVIIIASQCIMHLPLKIFELKRFYTFRINFKQENDENKIIKKLFNVVKFSKINFYNENGHIKVNAVIKTEQFYKDDDIIEILNKNNSISSIERLED